MFQQTRLIVRIGRSSLFDNQLMNIHIKTLLNLINQITNLSNPFISLNSRTLKNYS